MAGWQPGDLVFVPEVVGPGVTDWIPGVLTRTGGKNKGDAGSYRRLGEKRVRKIEPGFSIYKHIALGRGIDPSLLRPRVNHERMAEGWEAAMPPDPVRTEGHYLDVAFALIAAVRPFMREPAVLL